MNDPAHDTSAPRFDSAAARVSQPPTEAVRGVIDGRGATAWLATLAGSTVTGVETSLDRLVVALSGDPVHLLVLSAPISVGPSAAGPSMAEPASPEGVAALTRWLGRALTSVAVADPGVLVLAIGDEEVRIAADSNHESWEVRGMDGGLLTCLPGGGVTLRPAAPPEPALDEPASDPVAPQPATA